MTGAAEPQRSLTSLQAQVLGAVSESRHAASPSDVAESILCTPGSARSALAALERRGLVTAVYTGIGVRGRCFEITRRGSEVLAETFSDASAGAGGDRG